MTEGLTLVYEETISSPTSLLSVDAFTDAYDRYYVFGTSLKSATDNKNVNFRFRDSNGSLTDTVYANAFEQYAIGTTGSNAHAGATGNSSVVIADSLGNDTGETFNFKMMVFNPTSTSLNTTAYMENSFRQLNETIKSYFGGIYYQTNTSIVGFELFLESSVNWNAGQIKVFGVN